MKNTFNSIKEANTKNAKYISKHVRPIFQSSLKRFNANDAYNAARVDNNDMVEYVMPDEWSVICFSGKSMQLKFLKNTKFCGNSRNNLCCPYPILADNIRLEE